MILIDILSQGILLGGLYALFAAGLSLVFGIMRLVNLAHGDLIVLAGFLWLIPPTLIEAFAGRIINIHPALLPKYGGKGMYGHFVHEAVKAAGEKESGITIHYVDEHFDHGDNIFQASISIEDTDTPDSIAQKIHQLEYKYFPEVIRDLLNKLPE